MKNNILLIFIVFISGVVNAEDYSCSEHDHKLTINSVGKEHVNHKIVLNGKVSIKEIENEMWFVEKVKCKSTGFNIVASHIQYNEPTKKTFILIVNNNGYELK